MELPATSAFGEQRPPSAYAYFGMRLHGLAGGLQEPMRLYAPQPLH